MTDSLFPSGEWTGFYNYRPGARHRMDLRLTFANGLLSGDGRDDIGAFLIKGRYDPPSRGCHWTKSYLGAHDVFYRGFREGKGIWGTWEIGIRCHGGFHIWPRAAGEAQQAVAAEPAELTEAVAQLVEAEVTPAASYQDPGSASGIRGLRSKIPRKPRHSNSMLGSWVFPGAWCLELGALTAAAPSQFQSAHATPLA
jgi:hypothetical protein